ncbi:hypothetical protein [Mycolicibacterium sediminis]|uniref:hypothetical protein n=1 Tax=Mycolicibacterium sediminis TaxID=1286180 RepID=UPI0013D181DC|nr:hypothetical protein [Mycolicibacterium sediminis]
MSNALLTSSIVALLAALAVATLHRWRPPSSDAGPRVRPDRRPVVGIGTVRSTADPIVVEVESVSGQRFVGRLARGDDAVTAALRPGVVLLVSFDPSAREQLSLPDDVVAVGAAFDRAPADADAPVTDGRIDLVRDGTRASGVITGMRATGAIRDDRREVELDLMVRRPGGGQFPVHETALVPSSALGRVTPGSIVDAYYRSDDETAVAVCVPRG